VIANYKQQTAEQLLTTIIKRLQLSAAKFAIIHGSTDSSFDCTSDIDIAFSADPRTVVDPILRDLQSAGQAMTIQCLHYEVPYGFYYIISPSGNPLDFLHLDCLFDPYGINRYHLSTDYLLRNIDESAWFPRVGQPAQAVYLLSKRIIKGNATIEQLADIQKTLQGMSEKEITELRYWLGDDMPDSILGISIDDPNNTIAGRLQDLRTSVQRGFIRRHILAYLTGRCWTAIRLVKRLIRPSGLFIVLAGPDGSGKSTVNALLQQQLARAFRKTHNFHWRPNLLPKLGRGAPARTGDSSTNETPSITPKYGTGVSLARFAYYLLDFILGYWLLIHPWKARTTLVIGERYFLDILVHPARYGFKLPHWVMRFASYLVPKPDITVLLTNDPETINQRKAELPTQEIYRQLDAYNREITHWGNAIAVPTTGDATETTRAISDQVIRVLAQKHNANANAR
jgi:thymidylate kinase